mgnify:CR=1 FL=1
MYWTDPLIGTKWCLWAIVIDGDPVEGVPEAWGNITLEKGGRATGRGGCSWFVAHYVLDRRGIQFGPPSQTRIYGDRYGEVERAFLCALERARTYTVEGHMMKMFSEDQRTKMAFLDHPFVKKRVFPNGRRVLPRMS